MVSNLKFQGRNFFMLKDVKAKLKSRKGFSLVELIVVIAIMVILIAMLLPSVAGLIGQANSASGASAASSLYTAATTAVTANAAINDSSVRASNLTGTAENVSVKANMSGNVDWSKVKIFTDKNYTKVYCVYYEGSDGKVYVNPVNFTDSDDASKASRGEMKDDTTIDSINSIATPADTTVAVDSAAVLLPISGSSSGSSTT